MVVKVKATHLVKPAEPTWSGIFPLCEFDLAGDTTNANAIYFYDKPVDECWLDPSGNKVIETLKESLSRALVPFYPLAGRLRWVGNGGRLQLECNAMGAELIEAESSDKMYDLDNVTGLKERFRDLMPFLNYTKRPMEEIPLLVVQVTRFVCGGISFGLALSHPIADGKSGSHFIREWARLAVGKPLEVEPFLDRSILQDGTLNRYGKGIVDAKVVDAISRELCLNTKEMEEGKLVDPAAVLMSKEQIEKLKEVANNGMMSGVLLANGSNERPYSRFEVVAAHIWRNVSKARELKSYQITAIQVIVDFRNRLKPPLPSSYFGNAISTVKAYTEAGELISRPLSYACSKIRQAIEKVNNEYVFGTLEFLKNEKSITRFQLAEDRGTVTGPSNGDHNININSWLNLQTGVVDFGWGKPIYFGSPIGPSLEGDVLIHPHTNNGSVAVVVWLQPREKFIECMASPQL